MKNFVILSSLILRQNFPQKRTGQVRVRRTDGLKNKVGLTLVELLIVIAIFGIVIGIAFASYILGVKVYNRESTLSQMQTTGRSTLERILEDIKRATEVLDTVTVDSITYNSSDSVIILKIPSIDSSKNIIYDWDGNISYFDYIIYEIDTSLSKIKKSVSPNTASARNSQIGTEILSNVASSSNFSYYPENPPINWGDISRIDITLNLQKTVKGENLTVNLKSYAKIRNN